jgi:hypothetical protein
VEEIESGKNALKRTRRGLYYPNSVYYSSSDTRLMKQHKDEHHKGEYDKKDAEQDTCSEHCDYDASDENSERSELSEYRMSKRRDNKKTKSSKRGRPYTRVPLTPQQYDILMSYCQKHNLSEKSHGNFL